MMAIAPPGLAERNDSECARFVMITESRAASLMFTLPIPRDCPGSPVHGRYYEWLCLGAAGLERGEPNDADSVFLGYRPQVVILCSCEQAMRARSRSRSADEGRQEDVPGENVVARGRGT
jgi:hypothetical protein